MKLMIRVFTVSLALVFALSACGDKKDEAKKDEAKKDEAKKDEAKKDETKKDEAKKDTPPVPAEPPKPTFSDEQLKGLAVLDIPGFKRTMDGRVDMGVTAPLYVTEAKNEQGVAVEVMTGVGNCVACIENTAASFEKEKDKTPERMWMSKSMTENPDLVWEFGEMEIDGLKVVTVHILSYTEIKSDMGTSRSGTHKFSIHWNDGARQVRAMASAKGCFPKSLEELKTKMTDEELKTAATTVFKALAAKL